MSVFQQCSQCQAEYDAPADRRFHAQPNACSVCGPKVWLEDARNNRLPQRQWTDTLEQAAGLMKQGGILAIKGIGGFHLACDAGNEEAVSRLRHNKKRYHKAFALMASDLDMIARFARVNEPEAEMLRASAAPIVILDVSEGERLASQVAPKQSTLGFMLPYTPLHHLLLSHLSRPIVLTSGNRSDEPQCVDNGEARERLRGIADYWLLHDREIINRLDDSVIRWVDDKPRMLRRARGYAPAPINLPPGFENAPPILAFGGELKNTFCLVREGQAIVSQHMGDLEDSATHRDYRHNLNLYRRLFDHRPQILAVDQHPDYLSTQWGREQAETDALSLVEVQHHHAHITGCMAEYQLPLGCSPVLGVALDGLGYGADGEIWGGEFLKVDYTGYEKLAGFLPVAMLGGAKAMYEPWRNTYAHLMAAFDWATLERDYADLALIHFFRKQPLNNLNIMLKKTLNAPTASSAGRLFDAVAAAVDICREQVSHEGQAAIELEAVACPRTLATGRGYSFRTTTDKGLVLSWEPLWRGVLDDLKNGEAAPVISARFHQGLADAVSSLALSLCTEQQLNTVVLSGGVFQNRLLLELTGERLRRQGLSVLSPSQLPVNDGGLSFGQAVVAAARSLSP